MPTVIRQRAVGANIQHRVVRVTYEDLILAATSEAENVGDALPDNAVVMNAWLDLVEAFEHSASVTALSCAVGVSGDADAFVEETELLASSPTLTRKETRGTWAPGDGAQLLATFVATGDDHGDGTDTDYTAGIVDIHVMYVVV